MWAMSQMHADSELIETLGGAAKLARQLNEAEGVADRYDVQRVSNWKVRGIPAAVKLAHPELLLTGLVRKQPEPPKPEPLTQKVRSILKADAPVASDRSEDDIDLEPSGK